MGKSKRTRNIAAMFGARYGATVRKKWNEIMMRRKTVYVCPKCLRRKLVRISVGIWRCKKCGFTMAGGAYQPLYYEKLKGRV
ncbi:50S ribosomal protein L37ae [Candidatus Geothermarchaeota archaeon]|nr:MAG: 50S ribosomal protein L37ae [Candidatus Geothermarchaeota archaeon]